MRARVPRVERIAQLRDQLWYLVHDEPPCGRRPTCNRSAPEADDGTTGDCGSTGSMPTYAEPSGGRASCPPLFGQNAIARSACAVIVSEGFTPRLAETAEPSTTCKPELL